MYLSVTHNWQYTDYGGLALWQLTHAEPSQNWDGWPCPGSTPGGVTLFRYVTNHRGRLSLLPYVGR